MRNRVSVYVIGVLVASLGVGMLLCSLWAVYYKEEDLTSMLASAAIALLIGGIMFWYGRRDKEKMEVSHRNAFAIVTFGWLAACLIGALPYYLYAQMPALVYADAPSYHSDSADAVHKVDCDSRTGLGGEFCSYTNCLFESSSGFTTTGATILEQGLWDNPYSRAGGLPHALLFWRALTHLLGGMGIIVFGVAILPLLGVGGMQLFKAEVPGPVKDKMAPKVAETARLLWQAYAGFTFVEFLLLWVLGHSPYLALCHAFATMATGGFSPLSASIETLHSPASEWVITFFMFLAGVNFALHFSFFTRMKKLKFVYWRDYEFRFYTLLVIVATLVLFTYLLSHSDYHTSDALRHAAFQTTSILTTTGFSSQNFVFWGVGAQLVLFVLFFAGGCSGSTGGGIKCVRVFLLLRMAYNELKRLVHPHSVIQTKLSQAVVPGNIINSVAGFIVLYMVMYLMGALVMGLAGYDFVTSFTAVGATLGNIGPGLADVGPAANYNFMSIPIKAMHIFLMIAGRLEIYSVIIVLTPAFWKK